MCSVVCRLCVLVTGVFGAISCVIHRGGCALHVGRLVCISCVYIELA